MSTPAPPVVRTPDERHFFDSDDGVPLSLIHATSDQEPTKGPVLLIHGAAMRAEMFRPPGVKSIVDELQREGWDVWLLNWRGSLDFDPLPWTLDDVAVHDIPAGVRKVHALTGATSVKVIAHCQGAVATSMAAVAGLLPEVDTIIASGGSLHPLLPRGSKLKLHVLRKAIRHRLPYIDVAWGDGPERGFARLTRNVVRVWHAECRNPSCNMASFALGSGHPALWDHDNLEDATHEWIRTEMGKVPFSFYAQLAASDRAGQIVAARPSRVLPRRFADAPPQTHARFALFAGADSRAFLPESQRITYSFLERHNPGRNALYVVPGYKYTDLFIGRHAHLDVFPLMLAELER